MGTNVHRHVFFIYNKRKISLVADRYSNSGWYRSASINAFGSRRR